MPAGLFIDATPGFPKAVTSDDGVGLVVFGVLPTARWPRGVEAGDFVEVDLTSGQELGSRGWIDPASMHALGAFFANGGQRARVMALCATEPSDLGHAATFERAFDALEVADPGATALLAMPLLGYLPARSALAPWVLLLERAATGPGRFVLVDPPRDFHDPHRHGGLVDWAAELRSAAGATASFGAAYHPWLACGEERFSPSGSLAGLIARQELAHPHNGVSRAPANEPLHEVTHPAVALGAAAAEQLRDARINPIVAQPPRGVVALGAQTLSADPRWASIPTRRTVSRVVDALQRDGSWMPFEDLRPELLEAVERFVQTRLDSFFRAGLLVGEHASEAYRVRCDAALNPPEVRQRGEVHVELALRPVSAAREIVVELRLGAQ